jgi:hypothetical protein
MPYELLIAAGAFVAVITFILAVARLLWNRFASKQVMLLDAYHFVSITGRVFAELQITNKSNVDDKIMELTARLERGQERQIGTFTHVYDLTDTTSRLRDIMDRNGFTAAQYRKAIPLLVKGRDSRRLLATFDLPWKQEMRELSEGRTSWRAFGWVPPEDVDCVVGVKFVEAEKYNRGSSRYPSGFAGSLMQL